MRKSWAPSPGGARPRLSCRHERLNSSVSGNAISCVLQVCHGWPPERLGGAELYAACLRDGLAGLGLRSLAFAAGPRESRSDDTQVVRSPAGRARSYMRTQVRPWLEGRFREHLARCRPDVVHFHHLTHLSLGLPRLAQRSGAAVLMTLHDYWLRCPRGQLSDRQGRRCPGPQARRCADCLAGQLALDPLSALASRALSGLPVAARTWLREGLGRSKAGQLDSVAQQRTALVDAAVARVDRFLSPSAYLAQRMVRMGLPAGRVEIAPLPLVQPVSPLEAPGTGPLRFLFVGALIPTKGAHLQLDAFARLPAGAATLRLVGPAPAHDLDPDYASRLRQRAARVVGARLLPPFPPGSVSRILARADVLVVPSTWEENSPLVVREARAAGLRILASRRGGIPEIAPGARFFEPERRGELIAALRTELEVGRRRDAPARWDDPAEHARQMLTRYARIVAG